MSWGSWILLLIFLTSGLTGASALMRAEWRWARALQGIGLLKQVDRFVESNRRGLAWCNLGLGIALGIYTGILLSAFAARPLWNSSLLGPLFLVSGLSTGAALVAMLSKDEREHDLMLRLDVALILLEVSFIALWLTGLYTGGGSGREAAQLLMGGPYTAAFWSTVILVGLATPLLLELMALKGRWKGTVIAPALVLVGGLALRFVLVAAGQYAGIGG